MCVGTACSYVLGMHVNYLIFNVVGLAWCGLHAVGMFFVPESPYFLLRKGEYDLAAKSMKTLRGTEDNAMELTEIKVEIKLIKIGQAVEHTYSYVKYLFFGDVSEVGFPHAEF